MAEEQMLEQWARWLGVYDQNVVKKSLELCRLLDLKLKADISSTNRTVLCLDIAATQCGSPFDADEALKRLRCKHADYIRQRRTVEKILGVAKQTTIAELCVQLDLQPNVQTQAKRMFEVYRERAQIDDQSDFTHPQYAAMSVYQCCKAMRVRVSRSTLLRHSHLRGAQWTMLEKEWIKCMGPADGLLEAMQKLAGAKKAVGGKVAATTEGADGGDSKANKKTATVTKKEEVESYEDWRDRMLKKAYADIAASKNAPNPIAC